MSHDQLLLMLTIGGGIVLVLAAASLLIFDRASEPEITRRISKLREGATVEQRQSSRLLPTLIVLVQRLGNSMRDRMMSAKDANALAKTLAASGLEPAKAMPIFIGAKLACLFVVPLVTWLVVAIVLDSSVGKQALYTAGSLVVALMLPNWTMAFIRRPYQAALRRGIPDALDLMVVCAEAGLGLDSAVERVAQEMRQSNRPVGVEFSLLMHEMRIHADRRIALTNLAERTGQPALKRLSATIMQTIKYGTPLSQGLRTLAAEMRNERMIQFEERAGKLPALLVMPMMLFILPCLFIIILGKPANQLMAALAQIHH
jgi:tight adherence protein C